MPTNPPADGGSEPNCSDATAVSLPDGCSFVTLWDRRSLTVLRQAIQETMAQMKAEGKKSPNLNHTDEYLDRVGARFVTLISSK